MVTPAMGGCLKPVLVLHGLLGGGRMLAVFEDLTTCMIDEQGTTRVAVGFATKGVRKTTPSSPGQRSPRFRTRGQGSEGGGLRTTAPMGTAKLRKTKKTQKLVLQHVEKGSQLINSRKTIQSHGPLRDVDGQRPGELREGRMRTLGNALENEGGEAGRKARVAEKVSHGRNPDLGSDEVVLDSGKIKVDEAGHHSRLESIAARHPIRHSRRAVVEQRELSEAGLVDPRVSSREVEERLEFANDGEKSGGHDERLVEQRKEVNALGALETRKIGVLDQDAHRRRDSRRPEEDGEDRKEGVAFGQELETTDDRLSVRNGRLDGVGFGLGAEERRGVVVKRPAGGLE
ncbi:hypothetical protein THAOC_15694 [Thalassiosira oceanica]|uniref:Uncharacterized protein n=1 Tax=Thalassiosira oceanica TaxID=159749 RepID=K0SF66_THAOC|nr:hypothetical protein THAOC_15694 [Thalassiosira oceanica]|eukprot:EJK63634.1 hypothetical protein THAOC_15694 [Thalassiosira oceanica]